jgi:hypothetical protein
LYEAGAIALALLKKAPAEAEANHWRQLPLQRDCQLNLNQPSAKKTVAIDSEKPTKSRSQ